MVDVESVAVISTEASGEAFPWSGVELFDKSRGITWYVWYVETKRVTST